MNLMIKGMTRSLFQIVFFAVLLLVPAGTWQWPRAIQYIVVFGILNVITVVVLARYAPESLAVRVERGAAKNQPRADRIVSLFLALVTVAWYVCIPIDVFRLNLVSAPPLPVSILGSVICLAGYGLMTASVWQNRYAAPIVGDQSERDHVLIDIGLYGRIRHPLYLGFLLFLVGGALWLESFAAALAVPLAFSPIVARILIEEKTLQETLPGYREYMDRVPARLIPYVW